MVIAEIILVAIVLVAFFIFSYRYPKRGLVLLLCMGVGFGLGGAIGELWSYFGAVAGFLSGMIVVKKID